MTRCRRRDVILRRDRGLRFEAGIYDSRQDRAGTDPVIPNPQPRFLAGYQRSPWTDFTAGLQYYGEYMQRYGRYEAGLPAGFPKQDRLRQLLTLCGSRNS